SLAARFKLDARGDQLKAEVRAEAPRFAWHGAGAQAASSQVPEAGPGVVDLPGPDRVGRTGADRVELAGAELALDWRGPVDAPHRGRGSLRVQARSLGLIDAAATDIDARVEGGWDRHRIALRALLSGADTSLAVESAAEGGWPGLNDLSEAGQRPWLGRVTGLTLDGPLPGTWALRDAVAVRASMSEFALDEMCLDRSPAGLCATVGWTARGGPRADVTLRDLPSGWLERAANEAGGIGLPEGVSLSTRLGADVRVRGEDLSLVLLPGQGVVTLKEPPLDLPGRLPFRIEAASFHRESGKSRAAVDLDLERFGRAQAVVTLSPRGGTQALGGRVTARSSDLSWLSAAVPQLTRLQGGMDLDIALGGTLERPAVGPSGVLRVERARLPDAGIDLTDLVLDFKPVPGSGKGERGKTGGLPDVLLNGGAELAAPLTPGRAWSGPGVASGRLRIEGRLAGDGESVSLRVQGGPVPVMRLPDVSLDVAPDLLFRSEGGARVLEGTLRVPHGLYQATALPAGSVRVSGDELIVGEDATPNPASDDGPGPGSTPESTPLAGLRASLDIELGDDVRIDAFDLKARLGGRMNVRVREGRESAEGRIDLIEGRYKAYGQDLTLSRGFLLFSGPADDPSLDLRAKRTSVDGKTTAYLDVSGTLRAPRFAVSTEPAGSDADALAYLLTGRPLAGAGKGEKFDIYAAALGLGLDKGEPLFADVRRELGLDELQLSSGMRLQDTALSLGKYVNPDLFVGYSINLFDRAGAVLLRLRLTDALSVEGRSGQSQSLDLIYTIESR
ncbi:MAG: translocation/assembly module TamB domain-containing protein, partial [Gammaproteobacteria bacterium]